MKKTKQQKSKNKQKNPKKHLLVNNLILRQIFRTNFFSFIFLLWFLFVFFRRFPFFFNSCRFIIFSFTWVDFFTRLSCFIFSFLSFLLYFFNLLLTLQLIPILQYFIFNKPSSIDSLTLTPLPSLTCLVIYTGHAASIHIVFPSGTHPSPVLSRTKFLHEIGSPKSLPKMVLN